MHMSARIDLLLLPGRNVHRHHGVAIEPVF
jgi:hypothetical protein